MKIKNLILALACLSTFSAFAEEEKISKIDGQLVKVGEKNEYEYDYKKWNIGVNAFLLPADILSISGSYAVTSNIVARLGLAYNGNPKLKPETDGDRLMYNAGVPIYFKKAYNGFFVEPGMDSNAGAYVAGGYHWMWDSGFNVYAGMGGGRKGSMGMLQVAYAFNGPSF